MLVAFILATEVVSGQAAASQTDSLKQLVSAQQGDEQSRLLIQLSYQYAGSNPDTALVLLNQSVAVAETPEMRGKVFFEQAMLYRFLENDSQQHWTQPTKP